MRIFFTGLQRGDLVEIGKIVKPQGVRGEIKVVRWVDDLFDFSGCGEVFLLSATETSPPGFRADPRRCLLLKVRDQGEAVIVLLAGVENRDQAEKLRDLVVAIPALRLPSLAAGEIYWCQLAGMVVRLENGRELGWVDSLLPTAGHSVLVIVDKEGREYLVPVHDEFMQVQTSRIPTALARDGQAQADGAAQSRWLLLTPPPGLLELTGVK